MLGDTFENFTINFNALNPKVTFSGGDVMSGQVLFDLTKEAKIQSIMMEMKGKANVLWHQQGGRAPSHAARRGVVGAHRRRRGGGAGGRGRRTYSAELNFFNLTSIVMQSNNADGHTVLPPGKHVFPFTVQLPHGDFPPSFRGLHGRIVYSMVVAIHRPWHLAKEFDTEVKFTTRTDANHPHLRMPLTGSNAKTLCCLWCTSGPVSLNAQLERKGFSPGENLKVIAEIGNASSRTVTPYAKLVSEQIFYTANRGKKKYTSKVLLRKSGQTIGANTSDVHCEILLPIPNDATVTIANCQIIDVHYYVLVGLDISRSSSLEVKFPISLCSIPFNPNQPPSAVPQQNQYPNQYPAQSGPHPNPQPGQYPNPQPGQYPNPQPGQYPNPQPGQYPNPQPGQYPNPQPGQYPNPQPGQYPNPQPGLYPNPQPGPYPNPQPGPYPAPQPGQYPNQPGPYPNQPGTYQNPQPGPYPS